MPEMMTLIGWLQRHIPAEDSDPDVTRISHGDFRCSPARQISWLLCIFSTQLALRHCRPSRSLQFPSLIPIGRDL